MKINNKIIHSYLTIINRLSNVCVITYCMPQRIVCDSSKPSIEFHVNLRFDNFIKMDMHSLNMSDEFVKMNNIIFYSFFGKYPTYNGSKRIFFCYDPKFIKYDKEGKKIK